MQSKSKKSVKVKYKPNHSPICVTEWSSNGVPDGESNIDLNIKTDENQLKCEVKDPLSEVIYSGNQFIPNHRRFMILEVEENKARLKPCLYFRMKPQISFSVRKSSNLSSLSYKEQMDEYNEKFGSKRSLKRIEQRKKFAISFGEDDYQEMKDKTASIASKSSTPTDGIIKTKIDTADIINDTFLMPPRNQNAASAKEVYNINDIVSESIVTNVESSYDLENFLQNIHSPLVQHFAERAKNNLEKACCIFLDTLIKLKNLRSHDLKKVESHGSLGLQSFELQQYILENYTVSLNGSNKPVRTMTEKCKDKIIIHGLILSIYLNQFKPLLISEVSKVFLTSTLKMRKYGNIVGCHIDINKTKTERVFVFKLPLHSMDNKTYKRRRVN